MGKLAVISSCDVTQSFCIDRHQKFIFEFQAYNPLKLPPFSPIINKNPCYIMHRSTQDNTSQTLLHSLTLISHSTEMCCGRSRRPIAGF